MTIAYRLISLISGAAGVILLTGCGRDQVDGSLEVPIQARQQNASHSAPPLVTLTPKAAQMVRQLIAESQAPGEKLYLRIRVIPGGCQGFMQKLDLDPTTTTDDYIFEIEGVSTVVFQRQCDMLQGANVDFVDEDGQTGFKVENPNFKGEWTKKWLPILEGERDIK